MSATVGIRGVPSTVLVLSTLVFLGCAEKNTFQPPPPPQVIVSRPLVHSVTDYLEETATTEAVETVEIRARVKGFLDSVEFESGQDVKKGDLLYVIDPRPFEALRDKAQAALDVAKAEYVDAEERYQRAVKLAADRTISAEELGERKADRDVREASIKAAEADLREAELNLSYCQVVSPMDGRVGRTLVDPGNLVGATEMTHLTTVVKYDPIYATFNISEMALLKALDRRGERIEEDVKKQDIPFYLQRGTDDGFPFAGHLEYSDLAVDPRTRTYMARAVFPNQDEAIVPGLFVRVRMPIDVQENALLVPQRAVGVDQTGSYVMVVLSDNTVERRNIKTGATLGEFVVAEEGLASDDLLVTDGVQRARPGAQVEPREESLTSDSLPSESIDSESPPPDADAPEAEGGPAS